MLEPGDWLVVYSDDAVECQDPEGTPEDVLATGVSFGESHLQSRNRQFIHPEMQ